MFNNTSNVCAWEALQKPHSLMGFSSQELQDQGCNSKPILRSLASCSLLWGAVSPRGAPLSVLTRCI